MRALVSPYLARPLRPLHLACRQTYRRAGPRPPCCGCALADRCAWEKARGGAVATGRGKAPSG